MTMELGSWQSVLPLLLASGWAIVVLIAEMFSPAGRYRGVAWLTVVGLAVTAVAALKMPTGGVFAGALALDDFTVYFTVFTCVVAAITVLAAMDYLETTQVSGGEYYPLLLFAVVGVLVMAAATDLIVMFIGLETLSIAVYVLAGLWKRDPRSNEAAIKYFLMGAFASGFMLYGIALIYAVTESTHLAAIASVAASPAGDSTLLLFGVGMLIVGFGFKVSAVPFHLWTPDVYEGAPTSVTAFMSTAVKAGGFAAALRILMVALGPATAELTNLLWLLAAATMTVGNVVALRQTSLKRMLAYSSIAHSGYLLVGLTAGTPQAGAAVLFYLATYAAMNLGAFGVMMMMARSGAPTENISDLAGLGRTRPMIAAAMAICMLSLTGIPPLGGFIGKLSLFAAALDAGFPILVLVAIANSLISAAYYLGVIRTMYFEEGDAEPVAGRGYLGAATAIAVALTVILGVMPSTVLDAAAEALNTVVLGR